MQLMQTAVFQGNDGAGRIYDHHKTRTRMILSADKDVIITVYSMDTVKGAPTTQSGLFTGAIKATIERELRKATVNYRRVYRQYTHRLADVNLEIATLFRNKVRCKHPGTQAIIQAQIDVLADEAKAIQNAMATQESEYRAVETEAMTYLGGAIDDEMEVTM
ncbi:hypothetical protein [Sporosarcina sp. ITBMC105]